ncbi:host cell division inhibitor Icd-like protein [Proteus mirabilis]|uniref:host cell division inhibitor Icd-like protein n=3 Tax=Enterobacterales TaxID=91347 RepID=UPI001140587D
MMNIATNAYQVKGSLLAGNNSIWANRSLTKNLVSQSAKIYANQAILATNGGWDKGKHSKRGEFTPFAKGDLSHLSKEADYPHWQDLRVTNSYAQKKKDSVQAALIQLHSVEQARNYPDNIELVSRLPNNIGLPDYIGLVKYCQSSIGGWDLNLVNDVHSVGFFGFLCLRLIDSKIDLGKKLPESFSCGDFSLSDDLSDGSSVCLFIDHSPDCLALRCLRLISAFAEVTKNPAVLSPSSFNFSISSITSWGIRTVVICDFAFFAPVAITNTPCFWCISVYAKKIRLKVLKCISLGDSFKSEGEIHLRKQNPVDAENTYRASNHNVNRGNTMAMYKSTQTHPKFKWRFFSCQQSKYFSVEASNEKEARSLLPDSPCLFSARIRQEGDHA